MSVHSLVEVVRSRGSYPWTVYTVGTLWRDGERIAGFLREEDAWRYVRFINSHGIDWDGLTDCPDCCSEGIVEL